MDSVVFDGKEYTKASVLAAKFRYTQDYLGQLCRAKKVDARLVGRAWYVNLESLNNHRDGRYKVAEKPAEISPKKANSNYLSRIDVEPILKKKTVKILRNEHGKLSELPMKYEVDDYALIPKVFKEAVSVDLHVDQADAERVYVGKKTMKESLFEPEPLPEVYLHGSLRVNGMPEILENPVEVQAAKEAKQAEEEKSKPIEVAPIPKIHPKTIAVRPLKPRPVPIMQSGHKVSIDAIKTAPVAAVLPIAAAVPAVPAQVPASTKVPTKNVLPVQAPQFKPAAVIQKEQKAVPAPRPFVGVMAPMAVVLVALGIGTLIISTNLEVLTSSTSHDARLVIQAANLSRLYERLSQ